MPQRLTEDEIIHIIEKRFPTRSELCALGIGDDCAQVHESYDLLTTDASSQGIHFNLDWMSLGDAAYRCLTANFSDIAAMGGVPGPFLFSLGLPSNMCRTHEIEDICAGLNDCIRDHQAHSCTLIGGDVIESKEAVFFSITILGKSISKQSIKRTGAKADDELVVFGKMGRSVLGYLLLSKNIHENAYEEFYHDFRRPRALTSFAPKLHGIANAMMDLSDGITRDLPKMLKRSGLGARLNLEDLTFSKIEQETASILGHSCLDFALSGGEDFGIVAAIPNDKLNEALTLAETNAVPARLIGKCIEGEGLKCYFNDELFLPFDGGFDHFSEVADG